MSGDTRDLWYVQHGTSETSGPLATDVIMIGLKLGNIPLTARICPAGGKEWVALATHSAFAQVVHELAREANTPPSKDAAPSPPAFTQPVVPSPGGAPTVPTRGWFAQARARVRQLPARNLRVAVIILGSCFGAALLVVVVALVLLPDKAKPDYDACLDLHGKNNALASEKCAAAAYADPSSRAGKSAAELLVQIGAEEKAAADERALLLASADPNDWATLISKYPTSKEATAANDKQRRASSVCADLDVYTSQLTTGADDVVAVMPEVRTMNGKLPFNAGGLAILKNYTTVGKECAVNAQKYQQGLDNLHRHAVSPGEEPVVDGLSQGFSTLITALTGYADALRGRDGHTPLDAVGFEPITKPLPDITAELAGNMRTKCSALGGPDAGTNDGTDAKNPVLPAQALKVLRLYYRDFNAGRFDANRYFAANVDLYITMKNTTPEKINRYMIDLFPKQFTDFHSAMDEGSLASEGPGTFVFKQSGQYFQVGTQRQHNNVASVRVRLDSDGKITYFQEFAVVEQP